MWSQREPIDVYVPGSPDDPRTHIAPEGVAVRYGPPLHPDDVTIVDGIRCISVARTLIDLAECMDQDELRETFEIARMKGLLNIDDVHVSRARVEWRPSLAMLDQVISEFDE